MHIHRLSWQTSNCSLLLIYLPQKDERLSRLCWLNYSRLFTHMCVFDQKNMTLIAEHDLLATATYLVKADILLFIKFEFQIFLALM